MSTAQRPRLLSVEDNPETRVLLRTLLRDSYDVTLAADIQDAREALNQGEFDALLLDIHLGLKGKRDGVDLLHTIRDRDDVPDLPAVAVTAYAMPGDREDLLAEGFDAYVGKPFTGAELQSAIEEALS